MNKQEYQHYLKTPHWQVLRAYRKMASDYKCEHCGRRDKIEVHHLNYNSLYHEDFKDLQVLCHSCHREAHVKELLLKLIKNV